MRKFLLTVLPPLLASSLSIASDKEIENCFLARRLDAYNSEARAYDPKFDAQATLRLCEEQIGVGKQRIAVAREGWRACLAKEIMPLDDGVSPASDIAAAVQNLCIPEYESIAAALNVMLGFPPDFGNERPERWVSRTQATKEAALPLVLKLRATKIKERHKAKAPRISS